MRYVILVCLFILWAAPARAQEAGSEAAIQAVADSPEFADWLASYPAWEGYAYAQDEADTWYVEFYAGPEDDEEWLGYAVVNLASGQLGDWFAPKPLAPDIEAAQKPLVEAAVLNDAEVLALLTDFGAWDYEASFNRHEQHWEVWFWRGLQSWRAVVYFENEEPRLDDIQDGAVLDEEAAQAEARNRALRWAYEAPGLWEVLGKYEDWRAYSEAQAPGRWGVSFVVGQERVFFVLVELETGDILEAAQP
jgi:hypothetical protein